MTEHGHDDQRPVEAETHLPICSLAAQGLREEPRKTTVVPVDEYEQKRRRNCSRCDRPHPSACICAGLPERAIQLTRSRCVILQHPHESRRKNRSLPIVELSIQREQVKVIIGRRFGFSVDSKLCDFVNTGPVWLIFPGSGAVPLGKAVGELHKLDSEQGVESTVTLLILDGTWKYAKEMDQANKKHDQYPTRMLRVELSQADLESFAPRRFAIRKPPSENFLSTAEAISRVLTKVEGDHGIHEAIMRPLDLMVSRWFSFQQALEK